jgi:hypothetical protein
MGPAATREVYRTMITVTGEIDPRIWYGLACVVGGALLGALALGLYVWSTVRRINLPPGADTLTALRMTPLSVVILLDLLDLGLDFLGAPVAWVILGKLGLGPLRGVTMLESIIPGTQFIPTMTIAWVVARFLRPEARSAILPGTFRRS